MEFIDVKRKIFDNIQSLTPLQVIWAKTNGVKPAKPYLSMDLNSMAKVGESQITETTTPGQLAIKNHYECTLSLSYFGKDSFFYLDSIVNNMDKITFKEALDSVGLAFYDDGGVTDTSFVLDNNMWEDSANVDIFVRFALILNDNVSYINDIQVNGELVKEYPASIVHYYDGTIETNTELK